MKKKKKKILVLQIEREGFRKKYQKWDDYELYSADFCWFKVIKGKIDREKIDKVIRVIGEGFDAVFCESPEAFLIQFIMIKRGLKLPPFVIVDVDNLKRVREVCKLIEGMYGENPLEMILENPSIYWAYSVDKDLQPLIEAGIDRERLFYIPSSFYWQDEVFVDYRGSARNLKINSSDPLIKEVKESIVACGNNSRDYKTLIKAGNDLSKPIHIFCDIKSYRLDDYEENIKVHNYVPLRIFYQILSASRFVVIPLRKSDTCPGIATAGLAIGFGKPVISTDLKSMHDYVIDGYNGILVKPYDEQGLREALSTLTENKKEVERMGRNSLVLSNRLDEITRKNLKEMFKLATAS